MSDVILEMRNITKTFPGVKALDNVNFSVRAGEIHALVGEIGAGKQQLVEIAKALAKQVKLLILDEPTASLNETDSEALLQLLLEFKDHGIASILISHKLNEVSKVADAITVLRDGATIET